VIDVAATLERLGIEGRESGDEMVARCPLHAQRTGREDAHPSWSINMNTGLFLCFSCGYRGSLYTLVMDLEGVPDVEAAREFVVKGTLKNSIERIPGPYRPITQRTGMPESRLGAFIAPPAWALRSRRVTATACEYYGVLWSTYDESWILPIRDYDGLLLGWQSKGQVDRSFKNFPPGVKKSNTLFGYHRFTEGQMVVVESPLDAVRLYSEGITGAVATYGAIVSQKQIRLMSAADEVVMALDADEAGRKASRELLTATRGVLKAVRFFSYDGTVKDPGDMDSDAIRAGISSARSRVLGEKAL
jgi:DNA primase